MVFRERASSELAVPAGYGTTALAVPAACEKSLQTSVLGTPDAKMYGDTTLPTNLQVDKRFQEILLINALLGNQAV